MFSEADAFLDAIFAQPDDDTPRLVYADWLEEHGQPDLGQFVRLQCLIDPLTNDNPRRVELRQQEKKVWAAMKKRWGSFFRFTGIRKDHFRRGFHKDWLTIGAATFFSRYPEGWPWFPIRDLRLENAGGTAGQLAAAPELISQAVNLSIGGNVEPEYVTVLARIPRLPHIRWLSVGNTRLSREGLQELAAAPWLDGLRQLGLGSMAFVPGVELGRANTYWISSDVYPRGTAPTIRDQLLELADRLTT